MPKKIIEQEVEAQLLEANASDAEVEELIEESFFDKLTNLSNTSVALIAGIGLVLLIVFVTVVSGPGSIPAEALSQSTELEASAPMPMTMTMVPSASGGIERQGEGRHFFTTIKIPPAAATLYLSGSGASQKGDGSWGSMEEQAIDTFSKFKQTLEAEGWSMSDVVQVRAFAVAGEFGLLDFDGFNRGYREFFGTEENPQKPVRSFVQVADLVVPGWLVEIEIRAAKI
jgi:enamine deaminase RidA (YjgF/YER057c/UK114 family)